ncbi:MAG: hypothetical protein PGN29_10280 [Gordonia paraffinivorans]
MRRPVVLALTALSLLVTAPFRPRRADRALGAGSTVVIQQASGPSPGQCALAAVGTDAQGRVPGSHRRPLRPRRRPDPHRRPTHRRRTVVTSKRFTGEGVFVYDTLDYAFIQFTDVVRPARTTPGRDHRHRAPDGRSGRLQVRRRGRRPRRAVWRRRPHGAAGVQRPVVRQLR